MYRVFAFVLVMLVAAPVFGATPLAPVIKNAGFEETGQGIPSWEWYPGSGASCSVITENPHSGERCLQFTNNVGKPIIENFGRFQQWFGLLPGMKYELSAWVRGEDVVAGNFFTDWVNFRMHIPAGTYGWTRVSKVFYAQHYYSWVNFGMNVLAGAKSFAIDDIKLTPLGVPFKGKGIQAQYTTPGRVDGDDKNSPISISIKSSLKTPATVEASVTSAGKQVFNKKQAVKPGANQIDWEWNTGKLMTRNLKFSLRVADSRGRTIASASQDIEKLSEAILLAELDSIEKRLNGEFSALLSKCKGKGIPVDYPVATKTTVEQFLPLSRSDSKSLEKRRAELAIRDMNEALDASIAEMRACLEDPAVARNAVRYRTGELRIDGTSLIGDRVDSRGKRSTGPVFLCGYGHFSQVRTDMPRFPGYGVNIIQSSEFGPSAVLPEEDKVDLTAIHTLIKALDDAAKHNVKVDVLISPHYFPGWPAAKWPQLTSGGGGFIGYCVDLPEAKYVNEKFLRILVPMIKDKPALNSLCLSNEPAFSYTTGAPNTKPMWIGYLTEHYGDLKALNARYGTSYKSFDEVPMGGGLEDPQFYDWCMFNRERFTAWHKWLADVIHDMAPGLPVHSKLCTIVTLPSRIYSPSGVDVEMMGQACDFNGNDCCFYTDHEDGFVSHWQLQNVAYDMQRSFNRKPVFNSENHISRDFSMNYIDPGHFQTVLWQGAVHGQAATTIWIWERATSGAHSWCFYGNAMDRPGCALAVGTTCMDLNRFAAEVTALQNAKSPVAIVYSNASFMRDGEFIYTMNRVYEALNFCGVKIDFISETQLARGDGAKYRLVILPQVTHLPDGAVAGLRGLPSSTRLLVVGDSLARDQYCKAIAESGLKPIRDRAVTVAGSKTSRGLWPILRKHLAELGSQPEYRVVDAKTGQPVWGVEWLPAKVNGRQVINMVNLTEQPVEVKILRGNRAVRAKDLLSLGSRETVRLLKPEVPVLAEVAQ